MKKTSLKDYLSEFLNIDEMKFAPKSFEVVGDIALIEIPTELEKYDKQIGNCLLKLNPNIKVVLKKSGIHEGEFRTQNFNHIAGENRKETIYLENGILLKLNVEDVYFSSKLSTERDYLAKQVKENSKLLIMFSGCGPYTFNILKKEPNIEIIDSIEINPIGHKYALENLELNKNLLKKSKKFKQIVEELKKEKKIINEKEIISKLNYEIIHFYCGDVRKILDNELKNKKYDEIFMPLPKDAYQFLDCAFKAANKGAIVHMYDFAMEDEISSFSSEKVLAAAKKYEKDVEIIETRKVGQASPRKYRVCIDFKIL